MEYNGENLISIGSTGGGIFYLGQVSGMIFRHRPNPGKLEKVGNEEVPLPVYRNADSLLRFIEDHGYDK